MRQNAHSTAATLKSALSGMTTGIGHDLPIRQTRLFTTQLPRNPEVSDMTLRNALRWTFCLFALGIALVGMHLADGTNQTGSPQIGQAIHNCLQTAHMACFAEEVQGGQIEILGTYCPTEDSCDYSYQNGQARVRPIKP
jgi:hypothetical protein